MGNLAHTKIRAEIRAFIDSMLVPEVDTVAYKTLVTKKATLTEQLIAANQKLASLEALIPSNIQAVPTPKIRKVKSRRVRRYSRMDAAAVDIATFDLVVKNPGIARVNIVQMLRSQLKVGKSTAYRSIHRLMDANKLTYKPVAVAGDTKSYLGFYKVA